METMYINYGNYGTSTATKVSQAGVVYESDVVYNLVKEYKKLSSESKMTFLDLILEMDI
jgi:hypothetical protein